MKWGVRSGEVVKRLFKPIIDFKIWNPAKFLFIIGDQNGADRKGMGGDEHIKGSNGGALIFQVGPQPAVSQSYKT